MDILNTIIQIIIAFLVILEIIGVPLGIVLAILALTEKDHAAKIKKVWLMCVSFFGPIVLLFVTLSIWGLLRIITNTAAK